MTLVWALVGLCGVMAAVIGALGVVALRLARQMASMNSLLLVAVTGGHNEATMRSLTMLAKQEPPPQKLPEKLQGVAKQGLTMKMGTY
jgi:hypothetical protein